MARKRREDDAKKQVRTWNEIDGKKIRWQYFNTYIYIMFSFAPSIPIIITAQLSRKGASDVWNAIMEMVDMLPVFAVVYAISLGPFIVLSILNRFCFGKVLGVVDKDTLFLENREIFIKDIQEIVYHPRIILKHELNFSSATFTVRVNGSDTETFDVLHFPIYGMREIRRYHRRVKVKCDKKLWLLLLSPTVAAIIDALIR